jgi:hypothetical protein
MFIFAMETLVAFVFQRHEEKGGQQQRLAELRRVHHLLRDEERAA